MLGHHLLVGDVARHFAQAVHVVGEADQPRRDLVLGEHAEGVAHHGGAGDLAEGADMRQARGTVASLEDDGAGRLRNALQPAQDLARLLEGPGLAHMSMGKQLRIDLDLGRARLLARGEVGERDAGLGLLRLAALGLCRLGGLALALCVLALCVLARGVFEREGLLGTDMAGRAIGTHDEVFTDRFHRFVKPAIFRRNRTSLTPNWHWVGRVA